MDKQTLSELYTEYQNKEKDIMSKYGEKDGFVINGQVWWDYYKGFITDALAKINNNTFTEKDALHFYKNIIFIQKRLNDERKRLI